jgi:hypothetical protein
MSPGALKRIRRVERRSLPEALAAYHGGLISVRTLDLMLYWPPERQRTELERRLSDARERERKHRLVAETIRDYLNKLGERRVDLDALSKTIREALTIHASTSTI